MKLLAFLACALTFATINAQLPEGGSIWAVLVAGSNTWANYRHQSDVYHAYHVLHDHGVPDEQIIVFHFDDIANSIENPTPGVIINHYNGPNVYEGVPNDYTGLEVNVQNFFNVLLGDEAAMQGVGSGKVLKSGPTDHVFVNFVDHGAFGLVAFPYEEMYASDFIATLKSMHDKNLYGKLTFYLEACEAGSMFLELPTDINIYATTASDAVESSYATYWDPILQTYLGDVYSVNWMEDSDVQDLATYTLTEQFEKVKTLTTTSHCVEYGDVSINTLPVGEFQGLTAVPASKAKKAPKAPTDAVPSTEVHLEILKRKLEAAKTETEATSIKNQITQLLNNRAELKKTVKQIVRASVPDEVKVAAALGDLQADLTPAQKSCYETAVKHFSKVCYPLSQNNYALTQVRVFANMCKMNVLPSAMTSAIDQTCARPHIGVH